MKYLFLVLSLAFYGNCFAQPSQAEIDKMLKEAKDMLKQMGGDSLAQQKLKELEKNEKKFKDIVKDNPAQIKENKPGAFPVKQTKLLSLIPKKIMSKAEVKTYAGQLYAALKKRLPLQYVQSVEKIIAKLNNNPQLVIETAVAAAHLNAGEESVLLAAYAASELPEPNIVNNCAAIFTMAGLEPAAIPILKSLLPSYANNTTVLNNIGQAYAALGEKDSAMFFFGRCIKLDPNHAQARHCAGVIENSKGNKNGAKEHLQKSMEGGYDPDASRLVRFIDPEFKMNRFAKPQIKIPEYFNIHKYLPFPVPCSSIDDIPRALAEYKQYHDMLEQEIDKFEKQMKEATSGSDAIIGSITNNYTTGYSIPKTSMMNTSFYKFCSEMKVDLALEHAELVKRFANETDFFKQETKKLDDEYKKAVAAITKKYTSKEKAGCCGEGNTSCCTDTEAMCMEKNALINSYLPKYAALIKNIQLKMLHPFQNFNEMAYWDYLAYRPLIPAPSGLLTFRSMFYSFAISYLNNLQIYARPVILQPCKIVNEGNAAKRQGGNIDEPECPFEVKAEYKIFKFAFDCEKSSFTILATDNIKFVYSKDNFSKASSIEIEMGIEHKDKLEIIPGYTSSLGGGITESLVVEFDKDGKFSDFIIKGGVKVSAVATKKGIDPTVNITDDVKVSVETKDNLLATKLIKPQQLWKDSEKFTYTFSMKNGFSYEDGLLRPIADAIMGTKPQVQVNKNIKLGNK